MIEGEFSDEEIARMNGQGYNVYFFPNHPNQYTPGTFVDGQQVDVFEWIFVDMDLKEGKYPCKNSFIEVLKNKAPQPTLIVDSGGGIHAYWQVTDLTAESYLRLQRRIMRLLNTDEAVGKICQLMRAPGTMNTKLQGPPRKCQVLESSEAAYTCEELDKVLPPITQADEAYCQQHYAKTYRAEKPIKIDEALPHKFLKLLHTSKEVKELYVGDTDDRSKADYRLAHILYAEGFTKEEALGVLVNVRKALERAPVHRQNYAANLVDKIWAFEAGGELLSSSVRDILRKKKAAQGESLPCWPVFDGTYRGFRLTQVLGLIGGAGSGKTTLAINYFYHFVRSNPDYIHVFVSLEQPEEEIAARWARICGDNEAMHDRVHVLGNYNTDGSYRNLSLHEIEEYILKLEAKSKTKIGCIVIDHVGVLKKKGKDGENQGLIDIFHHMKAFAKRTNTFLVMQSQTSREKAGIGDLELDKDAAYGSTLFEWYCDYVVTTWQPLKRIYVTAPHMTCSAFKYCKIRHKNVKLDKVHEDAVQVLMFSPDTELLTVMTQENEAAYEHYNKMATTLRNKDRKREPTRITKIDWVENGKTDSNKRLS